MAHLVDQEAVKRNLGRTHRWVLVVASVLVLALGLLIWFHPTAGYAEGGSVIAGADLRRDMISLMCWLYGCATLVSTVMLYALLARTSRLLGHAIAYLAGLGSAALLMPLLDKFY